MVVELTKFDKNSIVYIKKILAYRAIIDKFRKVTRLTGLTGLKKTNSYI